MGRGSAQVRGVLYTNQVIYTIEASDVNYCRADAILVATHSQGCIASTQLIDRLISEGHINTGLNPVEVSNAVEALKFTPRSTPQKICVLGLCGVHHGPLHWLNNSTVVNPYITYFESSAARELFEFQVTILLMYTPKLQS
jgi:hypothetical protein